jgi:ATP-binding cassette, subfamily B (MDR/TAP), member 1
MFVALAFGVGFGFLIIGWCAAIVASDVASIYRQEYLHNLLKKKIPFFDKENNSAGTLTSRISTDATQLMQLLGGEMALQLVGFLGLIGSIIIAFYYGWKLTLVGIFSIMPLIMGAGYYRVRLEKDFERLNANVFAETAQFGAEAISGFRTVKALIMEDAIMSRFDNLLKEHIKNAVKNTKISTLVFSFSESAEMFCQALFFW